MELIEKIYGKNSSYFKIVYTTVIRLKETIFRIICYIIKPVFVYNNK